MAHIEFKPEIGTWPWAPVVQKNISLPEVVIMIVIIIINKL